MMQAADLITAYEDVRELVITEQLGTDRMTDAQYAGLWVHAFGDASRALAVLDGCDRASRKFYLTKWPTLRQLLVEAVERDNQEGEQP
jgi:hypothetical protein